MLFKKNKILNYGPVLAILICFLCFFSNFAKAATTQSYQIGLPQKDIGIDKVEYLIDGSPQGSTDGVKYKSIESGSKINFLIKFNEFYANSKVGDFKIFSENGVDSFIRLYVYDYDTKGNIITREVSKDKKIDTKQTYITSSITITESEILEIKFNGKTIEKDITLKLPSDESGESSGKPSSNPPLSDIIDVEYYAVVNNKDQDHKESTVGNDGNIILESIPYSSTFKVEATTKNGYNFKNGIIGTENFGENCKITQNLDSNNKMTITINSFEMNDASQTPNIIFKNIEKTDKCRLDLNGIGKFGTYFDWFEPVEGKENTIKQITSSPHYVSKGKYTFYVRHKTLSENYSANLNNRTKAITFDGVEIDPTFDSTQNKFEKYTDPKNTKIDSSGTEITLNKGTRNSSVKHDFYSDNDGEYYKFEIYLTENTSKLSFKEADNSDGEIADKEYKYAISFDDSYTKYAKQPNGNGSNYVQINGDSTYIAFYDDPSKDNRTPGTYSAKLKLTDEGNKKYGFSKPNIYLVPTNKISSLKEAISQSESGTEDENNKLSSYESYLASYSSTSSYGYTKEVNGPRTVVLGPSSSENNRSHFIKFPSAIGGAELEVTTEDKNGTEIAKKISNGYMVKCTESEETHTNTFTFTLTPNADSNNKYTIEVGEKSYDLSTIENDKFEDETFTINKGENGAYTCTVSNISKDLEISIRSSSKEQDNKIEFNCPGIGIKDINKVSYNFSGGGSVPVKTNEKEFKFQTELKEGFELAQDTQLEVIVNNNKENPLTPDNDGYYTINLENYSGTITVDITGAVFKTEKPNVEIITNESNLKCFQYVTTQGSTAELHEVTTKNQKDGNIIVSENDLTPGGSITFYVATSSKDELSASLLGSEVAKLESFVKIDSNSEEGNKIKERFSAVTQIYQVTINGIEENCKLSVYNTKEDNVTHHWTLTKSFELVPNIENIVNARFATTGSTTSDNIIFEKSTDNSGKTFFDINRKEFDFTISTADSSIYDLKEDGKVKCKLYSDKELTKEIDTSSFIDSDKIIQQDTNDLSKWKIDIKDREFEGSVPALSEYLTNRNEVDYSNKADYIYEKIYVGIIVEPLDSFEIYFTYNMAGDNTIEEYMDTDNDDYKGIKVSNIKVSAQEDDEDGEILSYKITEETVFDPDPNKATVNASEKSFAITLPEGFSYEDIIVSKQKPNSILTMFENGTHSTLFKYPIVSDLGTKDSFRISNVYSKKIYVHVKNLKQRELNVVFPEQYVEGTNIYILGTDSANNITEEAVSSKTVKYGENLKIRSRAKDGYKTDEISELILYTSNGSSYTFIDLSQSAPGPSPDKTDDSAWVTIKSLPKIVNEVSYKFTVDKGELVFDVEFKGIKNSFDVQLRRKKKDFTISFPAKNNNITVRNLNGDEITGDVSKSYKDSFSFSITPAVGIDITKLAVTDTDGNSYNLINGYYTINNIDKDITIMITGIEKETRTITFTDYDDITYLDSSGKTIGKSVSVEYGSSYEFRINFGSSISQLKDIENAIQVQLTNSASYDGENNQIEYDYKSHKCVVKSLTENSKITIDGITLNTYTLTFNKPDDYKNNNNTENTFKFTEAYSDNELTSDETVTSGSVLKKVTHGSNFSFRVSGGKGVDLTSLKVWLKKSENDKSPTQLIAIDNIYTVENIQGDYIVYTTDSKPTVYTVEIRTTTGVSCLDANGNTIAAKTEVNHGDSLVFRLSIDKIYDKSNPVVEIKGTTSTLSPDSSGYYRLENITEDKILQITGITKNTYKVTFEETEGVIYKTVKNKTFEKSMDVEYGDTLQFKITLMDAYDSSVPTVLLNNTAEISANAGIYKVEGISSDVAISVKNVKKNPEESAIEEITTVTNEISSSSDVDEIISATNAYNNLSDDQKDLVTNLDELNAAQKSAGVFNHTADGITVTGIDWYIKLVVTSLNDDKSAIEELNSHLDRKELINLYDIKLYDMLKNEVYKVPYGQEITVTIPYPENISDYENIMVVHENSAGGIEYLDVNLNSGTAQFKTTSFSKFGIAGKKIPLDSSKLTNATVSVSSLVSNEEELNSLLGENAASEIGELINTDEDDANSENSSNGSQNGSNSSGNSEGQNKESLKDKVYNWAVKNELSAVIIVLILGFGILALILIPILKKKSNDKKEKK